LHLEISYKQKQEMSQKNRHNKFKASILRLTLLSLILNCQLSTVNCQEPAWSTQAKADNAREGIGHAVFTKFNNVDNAGLDMATLKKNVISALKNADGTPIKELADIFNDPKIAKQIMDMFGQNATHAQGLINRLENETIFTQLFKIIE
jgi:hypothetical protein